MYRIVHGSSSDLPGTAGFIETLNTLDRHPNPRARQFFDSESDVFVTRAPGRLDVMGGIADYSGSLVLQMPIREATFAALQRNASRNLSIVTLVEAQARNTFFEMTLEDFENEGTPVDYETARAGFERDPGRRWAAYVAGVFIVLMRDRGTRFREGARIMIDSRVPEGKGVSSSAAIEVAVMQAVAAAHEISITPREIALLCQTVENRIAGAPCGVMDQMTAACGEENRLLVLLCQPAEVKGMIPIPDEISFWGLDSGERHSIGGADYASVRLGAFMGYRMIAEMAGLRVQGGGSDSLVEIDDPNWHGFLANIPPAEFASYEERLPKQIGGAEFLARFKGTTDSVARIDPDRAYAVRVPTAHPVYENNRVRRFAELMRGQAGERRLKLLGELMYQSHASYSACGLGSQGTDLLVRLVRETGAGQGLYGARITGGGSGGTVAVVGHRESGPAVATLAGMYEQETGHRPYVFSGSSNGSAAFGFLRLRHIG